MLVEYCPDARKAFTNLDTSGPGRHHRSGTRVRQRRQAPGEEDGGVVAPLQAPLTGPSWPHRSGPVEGAVGVVDGFDELDFAGPGLERVGGGRERAHDVDCDDVGGVPVRQVARRDPHRGAMRR